MATGKQDVANALKIHDPVVLRAILEAADVRDRGAEDADALAQRIADALWWNYGTLIGYATGRPTLEAIVDYVAGRLHVELDGPADAWARLRQLTVTLARTTSSRIDTAEPLGVRFDDLDDSLKRRLGDSWVPTAAASSAGATSLGLGLAGKLVVRLGNTPIGRVLPFIPHVGPVWIGLRKVGGVTATVGGPLAIALSVLALDQALGTNHRRLVPLLLGVGALGPTSVSDADEVAAK